MVGWQTRGESVIRLLIRCNEEPLISTVGITNNDLRLLSLRKLRCQISNLFRIMHVAGMCRLVVGYRSEPTTGGFLFFSAEGRIRGSHRRGGSTGGKRGDLRGSRDALNMYGNEEESGN